MLLLAKQQEKHRSNSIDAKSGDQDGLFFFSCSSERRSEIFLYIN